MPSQITAYRVFVASPGGLVPERKAFCAAIQEYNEIDAISRGVLFIPVGWEQTLPGMGRPQSLINEELKDCDYFLLVLWDRWGSPSGDPNYTSATSEEYATARRCWKEQTHSLLEIAAFFKAVDPRQMNDPGEQLKNVLDFRRELEKTKELLFGTFDDVSAFQGHVQRLLAKWVRDHEQNKGKKAKLAAVAPTTEAIPSQPLAAAASVTAGLSDLAKSRAVIEEAERLVAKGLLTDAETLFARALAKDNEPGTAIQYARFLRRIGRFSQAHAILEGILERPLDGEQHWKAGAYNYLGMLYRDRGDLDQAEKMLNRAQGFSQDPGSRETTIAAYNNLGQVFRDRGNLTEAEQMHRRALELCKPEGDEPGVAAAYGNLAHIYLIRDDLERADVHNRKAIEMAEKIRNEEGLAIALRNQGLLYLRRQQPALAEHALQRSLEIANKIGRQKSMADSCSSLAQLRIVERRFEDAEQLLTKSIEANERIGRKKGLARTLGLLGELQHLKGNDSQAEQSLLRAMDLARGVEDIRCLAKCYVSLGNIFRDRGEGTVATTLWQNAREIFVRMGLSEQIAEIDARLGTLRLGVHA